MIERGRPVMGEFDEPTGGQRAATQRPGFDGSCVGRVQDATLGRQQVVIGRLLHEGVPESVAFGGVGPVDDQELRVDGLVQGGPHLAV